MVTIYHDRSMTPGMIAVIRTSSALRGAWSAAINPNKNSLEIDNVITTLKHKLQSRLLDTGWRSATDLASLGVSNGAIGSAEIRVVECIEHFPTER